MNVYKIKSQLVNIILTMLTVTFCTLNGTAQQAINPREISIISWNIRDFGKTKSDSVINAIANTVRNYDIVAIQEIVAGYGGSQAIAKLANTLNRKGSKWDYSISNPTKSPRYKTEKYAYLWKTSKVSIYKKARLVSELNPIVYREPYLINFNVDGQNIKILNYHSRKHNDRPEEEISKIITYLNRYNQTILLGDFNLSENQTVWNNLYANNYTSAIQNNPTTLKKKCKHLKYVHQSTDNIYYDTTKINSTRAGKIDFVQNCDNLKKARKISDHLPVYMHFIFN